MAKGFLVTRRLRVVPEGGMDVCYSSEGKYIQVRIR